jgi:hypothetical protein
MAPVQAI